MTDSDTHERLYHGGNVLALDGISAPAEALLVRGERIAAVGTKEQVRTAATVTPEEVDLGGASLMPGLIDTHPHMFHFGVLAYPLVDLSDARNHDDIVERIRRKAAEVPEGKWILTTPVGEPHYFIRRSWHDLAEGALPDRHVLDRASVDHPIWLQAWGPRTPNDCVFNTRGLAEVGFGRSHPDRVGNVWLEKDSTGEPTGRVHGSVNTYYSGDEYWDSLVAPLPILDFDAAVPGTLAAMSDYNRMGVTTVYEGHAMGVNEIGLFGMLDAQDSLTVRVLTSLEAENYAMPWDKPLSDDEFTANLSQSKEMTSTQGKMLRHNGVTLSRGGPCWPGFLRMHDAYKDPYGNETTGRTFVSGAKEATALRWCAQNDLRLNFIGAGYKDHDEFLDRAEALNSNIPLAGRHWILQHNYLCTKEQARRYAALGFDVTTSMSFCWGKGDLLEQRIGSHVWKDLIPLRRLLDAGLAVACGSDWGPKNIFEQIQLAETHQFCGSGRCNDGPDQVVTREEALLMWTRDAGRVLQWQGVGTLEAGSLADMIVVDRDPSSCDVDSLPDTKVVQTVVGGRVVHDDGLLR